MQHLSYYYYCYYYILTFLSNLFLLGKSPFTTINLTLQKFSLRFQIQCMVSLSSPLTILCLSSASFSSFQFSNSCIQEAHNHFFHTAPSKP
jgi:hypothetical protein